MYITSLHEEYSRLRQCVGLGKILEWVDDVANFAGERQNAARLLQSCLQRLEWDEDSLRAACGGMAGSDTGKPTFATLQFTKRITMCREWFEEWYNHEA